jgi:hypothetical protein
VEGYCFLILRFHDGRARETLNGHIVKTICQLLNETEGTRAGPVLTLPFEEVWVKLSADLEGKIDTFRLNAIYTADFGKVTKQMVGRRLREVLDGRSRTCRKGERTIKVYEFDPRKVARAYQCLKSRDLRICQLVYRQLYILIPL